MGCPLRIWTGAPPGAVFVPSGSGCMMRAKALAAPQAASRSRKEAVAWRVLLPERVTELMMPPAARPYSAEKLEVLTRNWLMAERAVEYPPAAVPRSRPRKAMVLSTPSRVMSFIRGLRPRKLRAEVPSESGATPAARAARADQWPDGLGRLSMKVSSILLLTDGVRSASGA